MWKLDTCQDACMVPQTLKDELCIQLDTYCLVYAEPEPVVSTTSEKGVNQAPVNPRSSKKQTVQQTLVTLLPQTKILQDAAVAKLNSKKRSRDEDNVKKSHGLAASLRRTRSQAVAVA